ncbi:MAG: hypothetical protein AAF228_00380 [Pseudomonadota bacterium]
MANGIDNTPKDGWYFGTSGNDTVKTSSSTKSVATFGGNDRVIVSSDTKNAYFNGGSGVDWIDFSQVTRWTGGGLSYLGISAADVKSVGNYTITLKPNTTVTWQGNTFRGFENIKLPKGGIVSTAYFSSVQHEVQASDIIPKSTGQAIAPTMPKQ